MNYTNYKKMFKFYKKKCITIYYRNEKRKKKYIFKLKFNFMSFAHSELSHCIVEINCWLPMHIYILHIICMNTYLKIF